MAENTPDIPQDEPGGEANPSSLLTDISDLQAQVGQIQEQLDQLQTTSPEVGQTGQASMPTPPAGSLPDRSIHGHGLLTELDLRAQREEEAAQAELATATMEGPVAVSQDRETATKAGSDWPSYYMTPGEHLEKLAQAEKQAPSGGEPTSVPGSTDPEGTNTDILAGQPPIDSPEWEQWDQDEKAGLHKPGWREREAAANANPFHGAHEPTPEEIEAMPKTVETPAPGAITARDKPVPGEETTDYSPPVDESSEKLAGIEAEISEDDGTPANLNELREQIAAQEDTPERQARRAMVEGGAAYMERQRRQKVSEIEAGLPDKEESPEPPKPTGKKLTPEEYKEAVKKYGQQAADLAAEQVGGVEEPPAEEAQETAGKEDDSEAAEYRREMAERKLALAERREERLQRKAEKEEESPKKTDAFEDFMEAVGFPQFKRIGQIMEKFDAWWNPESEAEDAEPFEADVEIERAGEDVGIAGSPESERGADKGISSRHGKAGSKARERRAGKREDSWVPGGEEWAQAEEEAGEGKEFQHEGPGAGMGDQGGNRELLEAIRELTKSVDALKDEMANRDTFQPSGPEPMLTAQASSPDHGTHQAGHRPASAPPQGGLSQAIQWAVGKITGT